MIKRIRSVVFAAALVVAFAGDAFGQDRFEPDTLRYISDVRFTNSCSSSLRIEVPLFLFVDYPFSLIQFDLRWSNPAVLDTFVLSPPFNLPGAISYHSLEDADSARVYARLHGGFPCPIQGELGRLIFRCDIDDTLTLFTHCGNFFVGNAFFEYWNPTDCSVDTPLVIHPPSESVNGDADLSGFVTISDAVFVISHIFSGGCAPFFGNSADVNQDCQLSISDVVYLIQYIFAGGPPPQSGCI